MADRTDSAKSKCRFRESFGGTIDTAGSTAITGATRMCRSAFPKAMPLSIEGVNYGSFKTGGCCHLIRRNSTLRHLIRHDKRSDAPDTIAS